MTLFLDATPSAGGPRSRRSRGWRGALSLFALPSLSMGDCWLLVVSVRGSTSPSAGFSAPSSPRDWNDQWRSHPLYNELLTSRAPRPPRPARPRPRPRPRPPAPRRGRPSPPEPPSPPLAALSFFSPAVSGLRASWTETLRSRISLPESSEIARSASEGVERSTKAYPTGRSVRGFFGMDVDSL